MHTPASSGSPWWGSGTHGQFHPISARRLQTWQEWHLRTDDQICLKQEMAAPGRILPWALRNILLWKRQHRETQTKSIKFKGGRQEWWMGWRGWSVKEKASGNKSAQISSVTGTEEGGQARSPIQVQKDGNQITTPAKQSIKNKQYHRRWKLVQLNKLFNWGQGGRPLRMDASSTQWRYSTLTGARLEQSP